jgi:Protein of unknown function (DUF4242)
MSKIIIETNYDQPLTPEIMEEANERALPCLEARNAHWRYSLWSTDRCRMICNFDAPDAGTVREAYRKAGVPFDQIWAAEILSPDGGSPERDETRLKVVEGTYPPFTIEDWNEFNDKTLACYAERGVEWIRSFVSLDRRRVICEVNAPDAEAIRETYRKLGIPFDRVWSAELLLP